MRGEAMKTRIIWTLIILTVLFIFSMIMDLSWAADPLSFSEVIDVLLGHGTWANNIIVNSINAPRIVGAIFIGAGLSVAGAIMQAVFRNPMASPYTLGLSSGACFGAAIGILFTIPYLPSSISVPVLAFISCMATMMIVYSLSRVGNNVSVETLLLSGISVGAMFSAMVSFLTFISGDKIEGIVFWSMGSFGTINWNDMAVVAPTILLCIFATLFFSKDLNAMMLGDSHAMDLGVNTGKTRFRILIITAIMVATSVAFVGSIGFVGLVIPHIFRIILGPDNRLLIPFSAFGGSVFMLLCDYISRTVAFAYGVLPIGIVTAMIGAPYFIYLIRRRKKEVGW